MEPGAETGDANAEVRLHGAAPELPELAATELLLFATSPPPLIEDREGG